MTIKEAAELTGISVDNLRYYERIGLIPPVPRTASGIRDYNGMTLHWIEFVMRFKKAGVPLEGIIDYMRLAEEGSQTEGTRKAILQETREAIQEKIDMLIQCRDIVQYKLDNYYNVVQPQTQQLLDDYHKQQGGGQHV